MMTRAVSPLSKLTCMLAAAVALATMGCRSHRDEIVVGAYLSLSGADSTFGTDTRDGIQLAVDATNAAGGVHGKRVRVLYEDDKSLPGEATNKVRQLADRDKVVALLGEVASSRSIAGGLIANAMKVPMITPSSTADDVTRNRPYVFRICFTSSLQGAAAARLVHDVMGKSDAGIFYAAQDTYSSGLARAFRETFARLGGRVVVDKGYPKGETNFTTFLQELAAARPQVIFAPVYYNDMVLIARQAKSIGLPGSTFVGTDAWDSENLLEGASAELEGARFTNFYAPDVPWESSRTFLAAFRDRYARDPNSISAQGYDAARLLFDAIGRTKSATRDEVREAILATRNFTGATGEITIGADRNAAKAVVVVAIEGGRFHYSTRIKTSDDEVDHATVGGTL